MFENCGRARAALPSGGWGLEVHLGQLGLFANRFAPVGAGLVLLAHGHQGVAEIQKRFGELRILREGLLVKGDGVV